ncbi:MAG: isochorismatase family protein [Candidatus Parcubacteria bacterium]|nr:isochorismatase family protein [Burkholderiales bacterium]
MAKRPWDGIVPESEQQLYRNAGLGGRGGLGKRAALLVIDMQYRSMGETPKPIAESMKEYGTSCGEAGWRAVPGVALLIAEFRKRGLPVIYPYVAPKGIHHEGSFTAKMPGLLKVAPRGYDFVKEIEPSPEDLLLPKLQASAFFGTPLASHLVNMRVDSVVVTGCTTSGCVRGSAVDANAYNYRVVVPEDCVYDRSPTSHAVNLFDIAHKYADVVTAQETIAMMDS